VRVTQRDNAGLIKDKPYMLPYISYQVLNSSGIDKLVLSNNALSALDMREIARSLVTCTYVKYLDLSCNGLGADACCYFAQAVIKHRPPRVDVLSRPDKELEGSQKHGLELLEVLDLSRNHIDDDACVVLSACVPQMPALRTLDISDNYILALGCKSLANAILNLDHFQALHLNGNGLPSDSPGIGLLCRGK
jgi:Ran GTPase-activating protein (RanGAP) involved in mRNA processing and transport